MLSPSYLDTLPDDLVSLWQTVEDDILQDVARRIAKMDTVTETAEWQLWRYEQSAAVRQDVTRTLAKYSKKSDKEIRRLLQQAGADSLAADDKIHKAAGASPQPVNDSPALLNLLNAGYEQTAGTWKNLTATTARTVSGEFEAACDRAWLQVSSGAFDYQTAVKRAVDGLAAGGIKAITYPSGHKDTLEVAVRRAVLTGVHQTTAKLQIARMDEVGCDFVEVTAHAGARPEHALWQGRQYHRGGAMTYNGVRYPDFVSATHYGSGDGLCGWNCRHDFWPFWPGLSTPNHTDAELEALNAKTVEYNGEMYSEYEISQMQRAAERKVRAAKRTYLAEDAAGVDTTKAAVKLKQARQQLSQFIQDTGAYPFDSSARTSVAGFGRSEASKAVWAARKNSLQAVETSAKRDTIKAQDTAKTQGTDFYSGTELQNMPLAQLRKETAKLAAEWYQSGQSGISFPDGTDYSAITKQLTEGSSKTSLIKDYKSIRAKLEQAADGKTELIKTNAAGQPVIEVAHASTTGIPNSITQTTAKKGGINRNYYGEDGKQTKQISNNDHGHKSEESFGKHGEHTHDYVWDENNVPHRQNAREMTAAERKENSDIL
jgi:hypothetical protein